MATETKNPQRRKTPAHLLAVTCAVHLYASTAAATIDLSVHGELVTAQVVDEPASMVLDRMAAALGGQVRWIGAPDDRRVTATLRGRSLASALRLLVPGASFVLRETPARSGGSRFELVVHGASGMPSYSRASPPKPAHESDGTIGATESDGWVAATPASLLDLALSHEQPTARAAALLSLRRQGGDSDLLLGVFSQIASADVDARVRGVAVEWLGEQARAVGLLHEIAARDDDPGVRHRAAAFAAALDGIPSGEAPLDAVDF